MKIEAPSRTTFFGESSLRYWLDNDVSHYHTERDHQGEDNVIPFPVPATGSVSRASRSARAGDSGAF